MIKNLIRNLRFYYLMKIKWKKYSIGENFYAGMRVQLWAKNSLIIGKNFYIGRDSQIEADCTIGDNVIFGNKVAIVGKYDHHYQQLGVPIRMASRIRDESYNWKGLSSKTIIEDDVWVGYGAIIMSGVTIRKGSIIAAGAVVTKDTEAYSISGGNPARKITSRFTTEEDLKTHLTLEKDFLTKNKSYTGVEGFPVRNK
ncbi:acyltransferase [Cellulophaga sp. HaHa_2_95]|uniref:acyltransferase n=1 Tax=unclassified Cellulophaga TaxID=2634405 RepID=UPI001C4EF104|nr:acyltransferase [Cellulophaga sp. HaHa_2_95]QXP56890.1 acyltransferase [Cellulophaga sp. HaHa_2_95]